MGKELNDWHERLKNSRYNPPTPEEERHYLETRNYDALVMGNMRLVLDIARRYHAICRIPLSDLIQEGCMGVLKAVEKFDLERETRFSTYAIWWIKQKILRYSQNLGRQIRTPSHVAEIISKVFSNDNLDINSSPELVAEILDIPLEKAELAMFNIQHPLSLDYNPMQPVFPLAEILEDKSSRFDDEIIEKIFCQEVLAVAKKILKTRSYKILLMRNGVGEDEPRTLDYIGKKFGISRERVRQIERESIKKIKRSPLMQRFFEPGKNH